MGNRDKRDDKVKKPKKDAKSTSARAQITEVPPPVEVVKRKRKDEFADNAD